MNSNKISAGLALALVALFCVMGGRYLREKGATSWVAGGNALHARVKGNPAADLKIVEYIDYQCAACRQATMILDDYQKKYPERFQIQVKFHPLSSHPHGLISAIYGECSSRQGRFWPFHEGLFAEQAGWSAEMNPVAIFRRIAAETGLDLKKLEACVDDPRTREAVLREKGEGAARGVQSTPTVYINGKMLVGTHALLEELGKYFPHERKTGSAA